MSRVSPRDVDNRRPPQGLVWPVVVGGLLFWALACAPSPSPTEETVVPDGVTVLETVALEKKAAHEPARDEAITRARHVSESARCEGCNLVVISIDTLRADRLGTHGGSPANAPGLDAWASRATVFERAYSTANRTADAHMSIFTGLYPSVHQIRNASKLVDTPVLLLGIETLTEVLARRGYATAGFHGGGNVAGVYGFDRGFDHYEAYSRFDAPPDAAFERASSWLREPRDQPFFAFVHTYFIHDPYLPSAPYRALRVPPDATPLPTVESLAITADESFATIAERFWGAVDRTRPDHIAALSALYDAALREIDEPVSRFLATLDDRHDPNRPTVVVVLSDHGEEFMDHGMLTHHQLYDELLHVPFWIRVSGQETGRRITTPVSMVDVAPTLLDVLGAPPLATAQGMSLRGLLVGRDDSDVARSPVLSEKVWNLEPLKAIRSLRFDDDRKILSNLNRQNELYNLRVDPDERHNRADETDDYNALRRRLRGLAADNAARRAELTDGQTPTQRPIDDETIEQLKALGYGG